MKKTLAILLALSLVFTMMPFAVSAESTEIASGTCGDNITWVLTEDGTLTISGTGRMKDYNSYAANDKGQMTYVLPFDHLYDKIKVAVVEEGVTYIGDHAFLGATELTSVTFPDSLTAIGDQVFSNCDNLTTINFGAGLVETGIEVFSNCEVLTAVTLPQCDVDYGRSFFSGCSNLVSVTIPDTQTTLSETMFRNCKKLTQIHLPDSITEIGSKAFEGSGLTGIEIPESVTTMKRGVFYNCDSLTEVEIPGSLAEISPEMFYSCDNLTTVIFNKGTTEMSYEILRGCGNVQEITIPSTVTSLVRTFEGAIGLKTVTFLGNAPEMNSQTFYGITVTAYYPADNATWTEEVMQDYGGTITWVPYGEVSEPTVKWSSISTSLGGNIAMNFYVELSEDLVSDPDAYIQFSFAGKTVQVPLSEGKESQKNGVTVYQFSCPITSKNMTDEITAQVFNGQGAVGDPKTMAVDTYCNWVIENYKDEKTVNLMKAMLNYGASAQLLFKYRTDDLANASLADADKVFGAVDASGYKHSVVGTEDGIIAKSMTLLLDSETTVRVYFELTGDKPIEEYTFTVDGVEVEPQFKDGKYYIEKQNIAAHRLDDMHVFTCGGITVTYGGLSYVNQVMTYYTSGTTFDMASALYAYSKAAESYIG